MANRHCIQRTIPTGSLYHGRYTCQSGHIYRDLTLIADRMIELEVAPEGEEGPTEADALEFATFLQAAYENVRHLVFTDATTPIDVQSVENVQRRRRSRAAIIDDTD